MQDVLCDLALNPNLAPRSGLRPQEFGPLCGSDSSFRFTSSLRGGEASAQIRRGINVLIVRSTWKPPKPNAAGHKKSWLRYLVDRENYVQSIF